MAVNKDKIRELVEVFYQPAFKVFYVNSSDATNFVKPLGVFVSLGITTSMKVLEDIKDVISDCGYITTLAEISSKKFGGQYLNTLTNTAPSEQYRLNDFPDNVYNREESEVELKRLTDLMTESNDLSLMQETAPKVSKLRDLIGKLDETDGWNKHLIQNENGDYKIFHQLVNYKNIDGTEYRIGIYVTEKNT